jgi:TusA-related sulfurtransferase
MATRTIDARGCYCPGPLMELIAGLRLVAVGDELEVLSADPNSYDEIPEWCAKAKHEVVDREKRDDHVSVTVRKTH